MNPASEKELIEARRRWQGGDIVGAVSLSQRILEASPGHAGALHLLGLAARAAGEKERALDHLRQAAQSPDAPFGVFDALAQLYLERGLLDEAAGAAMQAIAIDDTQSRTWHRLAVIHAQRLRFEDARAAFERTVALDPRAAGALNNLGTVLQQLGRPDLAVQRYREALALNPNYAEAHSNLASALAVMGAYDESLTHARRAIALKPDYLSPYVHAAFAEADRGQCNAALQWIDRVPSLAAQTPPVLVARAEILRKFDRLDAGIAACEAAIAGEPDSGDAYNCLGMLFDAQGRDREAIAAFDRAASLSNRPAFPLARKAAVLMQIGQEQDALAAFEHARSLEPDSATVLYMWAAAKDFKINDADLAILEPLLAETRTPSYTDRMNLHFAVGNAYLERNDRARAFKHLHAGNRIKRSLIQYDPAADEHRIAATIAAYPAERVHAAPASGFPSDIPVFVIGMPRSGTTLVEQILASHPGIYGAGELRHLRLAVQQAEMRYGLEFPLFVQQLSADDYRELGRDYLERVGPPPEGALRVVDKMPFNSLYAGLIHRALPQARIIHCRRNPLDTCMSCYSKLFVTGQEFTFDLAELGRYYRAHDALMAHWRAVLPTDIFLEIDYENVVDDLEQEARRLVAFCGVDWSPSCLRFHETARPVRTASMAQVRKPLYRSSIGRWQEFREELSPLIAALGLPRAGDDAVA